MDEKGSQRRAFPQSSEKLKTRGIAGKLATRHAEDHPDVATCLNNLAVVYELQGRFRGAEALYRSGLAILEDPIGAGPIRWWPPLWKI